MDVFGWRNFPSGCRQIEDRVSKHLAVDAAPVSLDAIIRAFSDPQKPSIKNEISRATEEIWKATRPAWGDAYRFALEARGLNGDSWRGESVKVLLSGGGSRLPDVKAVFSESHIKWQQTMDFPPNPTLALPVPHLRYDVATNVPFDRMAVAYGLASQENFRFDLDPESYKIAPKPPPKDYGEDDGEGLIPKPGWLG